MKLLPSNRRQLIRMLIRLSVLLVLIILAFWYMSVMPGRSYHGPLAPLTPEEEQLRVRLQSHVAALATEIGERDICHPQELETAARYIEAAFGDMAYDVRRQEYTADRRQVRNIEVELPGTGSPPAIVVIGAHYDTVFPSEGVAAPGNLQGIGWSDHWSFWQHGYPGIMVTDTAPFRYTHYHTDQDTADKLDYPRLARVTAGLARMVAELAGNPP